MMKVNASPGMDMIDLISPDCSNSVEDTGVPNLSSGFLKNKDHKSNPLLKNLTNGQNGFVSSDEAEAIIDLDDDVDMDEPVSAELEDILLADDEPSDKNGAPSDVILEKEVKKDAVPAADEDKVRDAGDDLDTLLSKINDIVEDCAQPKKDAGEQIAEDKIETPTSTVADESEMPVDEGEVSIQATEQSIMTVDEEEDTGLASEATEKSTLNEEDNCAVTTTESKVIESPEEALLKPTADETADVAELRDDSAEDVVMLEEKTVADELISASDELDIPPATKILGPQDETEIFTNITQNSNETVEVANGTVDAEKANVFDSVVEKESAICSEEANKAEAEPKVSEEHTSQAEDSVNVENKNLEEAAEENAATSEQPTELKERKNSSDEKPEEPHDNDIESKKAEETLDESILEISDDDIIMEEPSNTVVSGVDAATNEVENETQEETTEVSAVLTNAVDTEKPTEEVAAAPSSDAGNEVTPSIAETSTSKVADADTSKAKGPTAPAIVKKVSDKAEETKQGVENLDKEKPEILDVDDSDDEIIFVKADEKTSGEASAKKDGKAVEVAKLDEVIEITDSAEPPNKDTNDEKVEEAKPTSVVAVEATAVEVKTTVVDVDDDEDVLLVEDDVKSKEDGKVTDEVKATEEVKASVEEEAKEEVKDSAEVSASEELKSAGEETASEELKASADVTEKVKPTEDVKAPAEAAEEKAVEEKTPATEEDSSKAVEQPEQSPADSLSETTNEITHEKKEAQEKDAESAKSNEDAKETENDDAKLIFDNSDNACDGLGSDKADSKKGEVTGEDATDENSNSGSSSSLLKVSHKPRTDGDDANDSNTNDDEEGEVNADLDEEADVVTIGDDDETGEAAPLAKRPRLSEEQSESATNTVAEKEPTETATKTAAAIKRSHDSLDDDEKKEDSNSTKKAKTLEDAVPSEELKAEPDVKPLKDCKIESGSTESTADDKSDIKLFKGVPSYIPVPLYPPPNLDANDKRFRLDFLKKFKKSFVKMTKADLEELVMQKVVEAIIYQSEFADMRKIIEKQEKTIVLHRSKLIQISRQFRELEKVHSDVLAGLEARSAQVIMPTKITRSVCLQASVPVKKNETISAPRAPVASITATPASSPAAQTVQKSPQRPSPQTSITTVQASSTPDARSSPNTGLVLNQRRPYPSKMVVQQRPPDSSPTSPPQRPAQNILNKNAPASTYTANPPRGRTNMQEQLQRQQQLARQQIQQQQLQNNGIRKVTVKPSTPTAVTNTPPVYRRPESMAQQTVASASIGMDKYMTSINQMSPGMPTTVSITPARPKEKTVIDLTDEDDAATVQTATVRQRATTPNTTTNNAATRVGTTMMTRIPVTPVTSNKPPQMTARKATAIGPKQNGNATVATPSGTSITRIHVNQAAARKSSFPPPLPPTPPQTAFNSSWKLPPPRPTIRISNLDNGIVISWTMEEAMERYAECVSYQIYAYQETNSTPTVDSWRMVGNVKAMLLPMAVTLTQFQEGQRYYFAIRAIDCHQRVGPFSSPKTWN